MTAADLSGRRVSDRPPLSSNVYISFVTTSEVSTGVRVNSSVCSNMASHVAEPEQLGRPMCGLVQPEHRTTPAHGPPCSCSGSFQQRSDRYTVRSSAE